MRRVSVIVPCYNYGRYLPACLESVLGQEGVDVRVLVIDDSSTDGSAEVGAALADAEPRVEHRHHPVNHGHIATYNEGFAWADGDYTLLLSADDLLVRGSLERAVAVMERWPAVGFVYGRTVFLREGRRTREPSVEAKGAKTWPGHTWVERRCEASINCISSPEVVLRTTLVKQLGGFDPDLPHSGDLEYWMRCAAHADVGYVKGADQAFYRVHGTSMMRTTYNRPLADLEQRHAAFAAVFERHGAFLPDPERLFRKAKDALAGEALWRACRALDRGEAETSGELAAFAERIHPDPAALPVHRRLQWRQRLGPRGRAVVRALPVGAVVRRVRTALEWQAMQRRGV